MKILEIVSTAAIAITVRPMGAKPHNGFIVTRKPCLLAIMQEGIMPQLPGKSLKVFKMNNIGKITQDIGPKSCFLLTKAKS